MSLKQRYPNKRLAVGCELTKGPLLFALSKYNHLVLFPINPSTVAKVGEAFVHSGAKDDPSDANIQTDILARHMDKLRPLVPESAEVRALAQLTEYRRTLVQDRVNLSNRITALLKNYFPQVLDWLNEKETTIFCDFLLKWPTLAVAKRARKQSLLQFFESHNARYPQVNENRILAIKQAMPLTDDPGVIEPNLLMFDCILPQLKLLMAAIDSLYQCYKIIRYCK